MKIYPHYSNEGFVNSYLVGNEIRKEALIIDPGKITGEVIGHIEKNGYRLSAVCITHNHIRHYGYGLPTLLKIYNPRIYAADQVLVGKHGKMLRGDCALSIAGFSVECFSVPGHSPDSYLFKINNCIFTGDSLTAGIVGSTLHSFAAKTLAEQLEKKLFIYDDALILLPGHGPPTTIGVERDFTHANLRGKPVSSPHP
ncbi:MBL fold metallo-hydrolase [Treponema sp. OMZ 305]|uniref:MBL fold metallo-hydrolase n=1 Tax=Treponema TaxID=157 RepID=UPI001BAEC436|nr:MULTISPECIES: MBL fold metallo-hydrolase [Treponema]QUY18679.1 MBL fold metallo-hydrolase [Treponema vincentii]UTC58579.1 MBL fold metallo-hydrolase [Treponema sp. OMZ 305]